MLSTAILDLETCSLEADKGIILCGVIQSSERKKPYVIRTDDTNKKWDAGKRGDDKETVAQIAEILVKHDVLVAHNGSRFDLPYLRTRMLRWGLPRMPDMKLVDPCSVAWRKFRLRSNSLNNIADYLGVKDRKTPLNLSVWMDAQLNGTRTSMDLIVEHCVADVKVLAAVFDAVRPYLKLLDDKGSAL